MFVPQLTQSFSSPIDCIPEDILINYGVYFTPTELESICLVSHFWYWWGHQHLKIFKRYSYIITKHSKLSRLDYQRVLSSSLTVIGLDLTSFKKWEPILSKASKLVFSRIKENFSQWHSSQYLDFKATSVTINHCATLQELCFSLDNCQELIIEGCPNLRRYPSLPEITNLEIIGYPPGPHLYSSTLPGCLEPESIFPSKLKQLTLIGLVGIDTQILTRIVTTQNIVYLDLTHCRHVRDLSPLGDSHTLKTLFLNYTPITDLTPIQNLTRLEILDLSNCIRIRDVSPVGHVKYLNLTKTHVVDISSLSDVEQLDLDYCHYIHDFRCLRNVIRLSVIKTNFSDRDLQYLNDCQSELLILDARWTGLRNVDVTRLNIKIINLEYCQQLTSFQIQEQCIGYLPRNFQK